MDKRVLKGWLNNAGENETLPDWKQKILIDLWDVMMYWGSCDGSFYTVRALAHEMGVSTNTIYAKIKRFKREFPEAYDKLEADRARAKRVCKRQAESFHNPLSWDRLKEDSGPEVEGWVKEQF